jgi:hypothetical protein
MKRNGEWGAMGLCALGGLVLGLALLANRPYAADAPAYKARVELLTLLAAPVLAISADCSSTKDITDGLSGCLGDTPASYCYHSSCDTVCLPSPSAQETYALRITS